MLFALVGNALWNTPINIDGMSLSHVQFDDLMHFAHQQTVSGLVVNALINNKVKLERRDVLSMLAVKEKLRRSNVMLLDAVNSFCSLLSNHEIRFVVVKGQTIAALYPDPYARTPGDVDSYVSPQDFEKAMAVIKEYWQPSDISFTALSKHFAFSHEGVEFEMHRRLIDFLSKRNRDYWQWLFDTALDNNLHQIVVNHKPIPVFNATLNVLYVFVHLYMHLLILGVGLRQFCDVAILLHGYKDDIDAQMLKAHLDGINCYNAFCAIGAVLVDCIGMPADSFPFTIEPFHRNYMASILNAVFKRGNFGMHNRKIQHAGWLHSIETGFVTINHCLSFYKLSPREIAALVPNQIVQSVKTNLLRMG